VSSVLNQPVIDELLLKADSKYTVVIAVARRARQLNDGAEPFIQTTSNKPVTIALQEFGAGLIKYRRRSQ